MTVEANFPEAHSTVITAQDDDLDLHIAKGLAENADLHHMIEQAGPSLREDIVSTIKQNCSGMYAVPHFGFSVYTADGCYRFLHAALELDALHGCFNVHEVRRTLKMFPSKIEDVYRQTWVRISNQSRNLSSHVRAVLVWALYASRPMTLEELERAVATSLETHTFEASRRVPGANLMSMCRGLVVVEEESRLVRLVRELPINPSIHCS